MLTEGSLPPELCSYAGVYKYQASAQVVREVMARYGEERPAPAEAVPVLKKTTEILGFIPLWALQEDFLCLNFGPDHFREASGALREYGRILRF